ncbi:MAG: type IV pilin protein [Zoogloeaceae bacterium]|nr:type IV pilin protein [Zoogloeaceae bacterium]
MRRTRRIDCEGVLMSAAAAQERHHASTGRYTSLQKEFGRCPAAGASKFYDVSIVPAKPTTSYTLKAVPVGIQQKDTCGTLTLTHNGQKGLEKATATDTGRCWQ